MLSGKPLLERAVQRANIRLLAMQGIYAVHLPNGAHLAGDKVARAKQVAALVADGMSPGFPDLLLIDQRQPRVGLIEVKREGRSEIDPDQVRWRDECRRIGIPWGIVNTADGALAVVRDWGWR